MFCTLSNATLCLRTAKKELIFHGWQFASQGLPSFLVVAIAAAARQGCSTTEAAKMAQHCIVIDETMQTSTTDGPHCNWAPLDLDDSFRQMRTSSTMSQCQRRFVLGDPGLIAICFLMKGPLR